MQLDCGRLGDAAQPNADSSNTSRGGRRPSVTVSLCLGAWSASAQLQGRGLGPSTDASLGAWREIVPLQGRGPTTAAANCLGAWSASAQMQGRGPLPSLTAGGADWGLPLAVHTPDQSANACLLLHWLKEENNITPFISVLLPSTPPS